MSVMSPARLAGALAGAAGGNTADGALVGRLEGIRCIKKTAYIDLDISVMINVFCHLHSI